MAFDCPQQPGCRLESAVRGISGPCRQPRRDYSSWVEQVTPALAETIQSQRKPDRRPERTGERSKAPVRRSLAKEPRSVGHAGRRKNLRSAHRTYDCATNRYARPGWQHHRAGRLAHPMVCGDQPAGQSVKKEFWRTSLQPGLPGRLGGSVDCAAGDQFPLFSARHRRRSAGPPAFIVPTAVLVPNRHSSQADPPPAAQKPALLVALCPGGSGSLGAIPITRDRAGSRYFGRAARAAGYFYPGDWLRFLPDNRLTARYRPRFTVLCALDLCRR